MSAQVKTVLRTVSVAVRVPGRESSPRARTYSGQRRRSEQRPLVFAQVRDRVEVQAGAYCKIADDSLPRFESWTCH
jgi:hypothetical protein